MKLNIGVLLAGSGVFDGSEIQEAVFTLLTIDQLGGNAYCIAPDKNQYHVVNHISGEEQAEPRNVLVESARIARGKITALSSDTSAQIDALIIPGGFGAAENLNQWALKGSDGEIDPDVKALILDMVKAGKPICGLCMGPTVISKALEGSPYQPILTLGTTVSASPYDIQSMSDGMTSIGTQSVMKDIDEIAIDESLKIVSATCYNMEVSIAQVHDNVQMAVKQVFKWL